MSVVVSGADAAAAGAAIAMRSKVTALPAELAASSARSVSICLVGGGDTA
jgi:hypothetical protein